jgi:hypothetical protein
MAFYLINAKPKSNVLQEQIDTGEIAELKPNGKSLVRGVRDARIDKHDRMVWIEEDYSPSLKMEKETVLDFEDVQSEKVQSEEEGWKRISNLPLCWFLV